MKNKMVAVAITQTTDGYIISSFLYEVFAPETHSNANTVVVSTLDEVVSWIKDNLK